MEIPTLIDFINTLEPIRQAEPKPWAMNTYGNTFAVDATTVESVNITLNLFSIYTFVDINFFFIGLLF